MNVSYKWLSSLVDLEGIEINDLAKKITEAGLEVEEIIKLADATSLVVGYVEECENHPSSDHLHVCKVNLGDETTQIVCGAPNMRKGLKVIVAKVGCALPSLGATITKSTIRGVESNGMCCSLAELGVDSKYLTEKDIAGIHELDDNAEVGNTDVLGYLGLNDTILEVKLTPNRGDCQSLYNLARDIAAIMNRKMKHEFKNATSVKGESSKVTVSSATDKCDYFSARKINGIKIKESPKWMKEALMGSGVRPINNIVDISNYLMLLFGQPMHMYDADKLKGLNFVVKNDINEKINTLDGNEIEILNKDLVVTVGNESACLAGVMGLESTMIDENTKNIVIEVASFDGVSVRKTATRLQLFSDSSARYIKGLDKTGFKKVMDYATTMVMEYASPDSVEEVAVYDKVEYKEKVIDITTEKVNNVLGTSFTQEEVLDCFKRLSFEYKVEGNNIKVKVPSYRNDITIKEDLIEEVIRIQGFDKISSTLPTMSESFGVYTTEQLNRMNLRNHLMSLGLNEVMTYTLTSKEQAYSFDIFTKENEAIKLLSPISKDREYLRKSVIPSLIETIDYNDSRQVEDVNIFEISKVYSSNYEGERLTIALYGKLNQTRWLENKESDFYTIKGMVESIFEQLGVAISRISYTTNTDSKEFHPYRSAIVSVDRKVVGVFGEIHPNVLKEYKLDKVCAAELDLGVLFNVKTSKTKYKKISQFPSIRRDVALLLKEDITCDEVIRTIKKSGREIVSEVTVFDEYKGVGINPGYKSLAINIVYQDSNKTLQDSEVVSAHKVIIDTLITKLGAEIR